jgi:uncharacterized membrane protein YfcA
MSASYLSLAQVALTFVLAGAVKGVTGMGLPTVAIGLLGLMMAPAQAAALLVVPSLVTNVWQFAAGPRRWATLRRLWPMLLAIFAATCLSTGLITGSSAGRATVALGAALVIYALVSLAKVQMPVSRRMEPWLSPVVGAATGVVTGATGVFVIPAVPYLQALGLEKDDLVQALGLSFTVSTIALGIGLAANDALHIAALGTSALYTVPALAGMFLGQAIRARVDAATFRLVFFIGLLLLGADLIFR